MLGIWEDIYLAAAKRASVGESILSTQKSFGATDLGADIGRCALPALGHSEFAVGIRTLSRQTVDGVMGNKLVDTVNQTWLPVTSFEFELDAKTFAFFAWLFFQDGATQVSTNIKTFQMQRTSVCEVWATLGRRLAMSELAYAQYIDGAICTDMIISGRSGDAYHMKVGLVGRKYGTFDATASTIQFPEDRILMFKDTFFTSPLFSGQNVESFSLSLRNNAQPKYYGSVFANEFRLGRFEGSAEIVYAYDRLSVDLKKNAQPNVSCGIEVMLATPPRAFTISLAGALVSIEDVAADEQQQRAVIDLKFSADKEPILITVDDHVNRVIA